MMYEVLRCIDFVSFVLALHHCSDLFVHAAGNDHFWTLFCSIKQQRSYFRGMPMAV